MKRSAFIVIEGTDGSGKGTQTKILQEHLRQEGYPVEVFDFPQYGQPSAFFVEQYLNGQFGELDTIGAYKGSLFYALDRYAASFKIRDSLNNGKVVVSNRYVGSNMGHQGGKFSDSKKQQEYFIWNEHLEFDILGTPRPDLNIVLHVPANLAQRLVDLKDTRTYTKQKRDLHEADLEHLEHAEQSYLTMCELFPEQFRLVECSRNGKMLTKEEISEMIWTLVSALI